VAKNVIFCVPRVVEVAIKEFRSFELMAFPSRQIGNCKSRPGKLPEKRRIGVIDALDKETSSTRRETTGGDRDQKLEGKGKFHGNLDSKGPRCQGTDHWGVWGGGGGVLTSLTQG